jgi:putative ABC transport system substrate-binding protein
MKRRVFIALVAGAVARPRAALTQQPTKVYRIAIVSPSDPVSQMTEIRRERGSKDCLMFALGEG